MPEHPPPPEDFTAFQNSVLAQLRELQKRVLGLPDNIPLETFEDGQSLGPTQFLNFGTGLNAELVSKGYVEVNAAAAGAGGGSGWDAICDCSLTESDPENRLFKGIGEALNYLRTEVGLEWRAFVLVRKHPTSTSVATNLYTETVDPGAIPDHVYLFGSNPSPEQAPNAAPLPTWDHNGFNLSATYWYISGLKIIGKASAGVVSAKTSLFDASHVFIVDSLLIAGSGMQLTSGRALVASGFSRLVRCQLEHSAAPPLAFTEARECFIDQGVGGTYNPASGARLVMEDCVYACGATTTWQVPADTRIRMRDAGSHSAQLTITSASPTRLDIDWWLSGMTPAVTVTGTIGSSGQVRLRGLFGAVTLPAPTGSNPHYCEGSFAGPLDVTGPAILNVTQHQGQRVICRGHSISGHIAVKAAHAGGTFLDFIAADGCNIDVAADGSGTSGTAKPYAFDASSDRNILDFAGASQFPVAGTDAGTGNLIRTT